MTNFWERQTNVTPKAEQAGGLPPVTEIILMLLSQLLGDGQRELPEEPMSYPIQVYNPGEEKSYTEWSYPPAMIPPFEENVPPPNPWQRARRI